LLVTNGCTCGSSSNKLNDGISATVGPIALKTCLKWSELPLAS
jgi:hypothetical protein